MRKIQLFLIITLFALAGCGKDNFYDKYPPEIMFYQNADVENANFNMITLAQGATQYIVKTRVSAPYKIKEIKVYKSVASLNTNLDLVNIYSDFLLTPNVVKLSTTILMDKQVTVLKIVATDMNNKVSTKFFKINVTP